MNSKNIKYISLLFAAVFMFACSSTTTENIKVTFTQATKTVAKGSKLVLTAAATGGSKTDVTFATKTTTPANATGITYKKLTGNTAEIIVANDSNATKVTVMATSDEDSSKLATVEITITTPPVATGAVAFTGNTFTVVKGNTLALAAAANATDPKVTFTVQSKVPTDATGVTVATGTTGLTGTLTVTAASTATSVTIRATSVADNTKYKDQVITITSPSEAPPVTRSEADYMGMIVGSSGHFYVKVDSSNGKLTITVDGVTKTISTTTVATQGGGKLYTFSADGYMFKILVASDGTVTIPANGITIPGHSDAIAEIAQVLTGADAPKIFEGYSKVYAVRQGQDNTEANRIELLRYNYNVVRKGNKLTVMSKIKTDTDEINRLKAIWNAKNIMIDDSIIQFVKTNLNPEKEVFTVTTTSTGITVTRDSGSGPAGSNIEFGVTTVDGKTKLTFPAKSFTLPTGVTITDTTGGGSVDFSGTYFIEADITELL